jgi:2-phospho-L-lactate guanylyltransferase
MKLWLLIPVKPFRESKSRLAGVLDAGERADLSRQLLEGVIGLAQASGLFHRILVISRDAQVHAMAQRTGIMSVQEIAALDEPTGIPAELGPRTGAYTPTGGEAAGRVMLDAAPELRGESTLNQALASGRASAMANGADALLVLPADLPLLTSEDLYALTAPILEPLALSDPVEQTGRVVLAPSHDGGTNALLLHPPDVIPFAFGVRSFDRHYAAAEAAGCAVSIVRTPSLAYDLDLPEDLWGEDLGV